MKTKYNTNCLILQIEGISKLIQTYQTNNAEMPNYLIMSEDTQKLIKDDYSKLLIKTTQHDTNWIANYKNTYGQCYGIDIAICNKLKLGEVEVV